jgi:hypothetical protein
LPHRGVTFAVSLLLLSALIAGGCKGGGGKSGEDPTLTLEATLTEGTATAESPSETPTPAPDIHQEDLSQAPPVVDFIGTTGTSVDTVGISYADLTEDGVVDAIVPISSGGEGGDVGLLVVGYGQDGLMEFLRIADVLSLSYVITPTGRLQVDTPQFTASDPLCCPSQILRTTYRWDGEGLVPDIEKTIDTEPKP